jgi:uncharacterized protein YdaU (DUF1376 family)
VSGPGFPWLKWYPRDFASSTRGWPLVARAVYRELLDAQWDLGGAQPGVLPDDPEQLRELARASEAEWKTAWRFVSRKFPRLEEGGRQNARLEEHRQAAVREFEGKSRGAAKTNAKRWAATSLSAPVSDSHSDSVSESLSDRKSLNGRVAQRIAQRVASSSSSSARTEEEPNEGKRVREEALPLASRSAPAGEPATPSPDSAAHPAGGPP